MFCALALFSCCPAKSKIGQIFAWPGLHGSCISLCVHNRLYECKAAMFGEVWHLIYFCALLNYVVLFANDPQSWKNKAGEHWLCGCKVLLLRGKLLFLCGKNINSGFIHICSVLDVLHLNYYSSEGCNSSSCQRPLEHLSILMSSLCHLTNSLYEVMSGSIV